MRMTALALAALFAAPVAADPIYDMCMHPGKYGHEQCDCMAAEMATAFTLDERQLYSALADRYLERMGEGMGMADAWDAAVQSEAMKRSVTFATLLSRANGLGKRHREILDGCGG